MSDPQPLSSTAPLPPEGLAPLEGFGPQRLSDVVYENMLSRVVSGHHPVGSRLPSEQQLATEFQVSRPVVRAALARLRDDGVIQSRRGSGSFVRRSLSRAAMKLAPISSILDMSRCFECRISLEGEVAYHAALTQSEDARAALAAAFERLDAAVARNELAVEEDYAFHSAIATATENRFFEALMSVVSESTVASMVVTRSLSMLRPRERLMAVHQEHRDIYEAIMAHEPERAREAMRNHLTRARRRVFEGTDV